MEDSAIINLYWNRQENAIAQTKIKYGNYLSGISMNILHSAEDAEECVNDTYLRAWMAIPPARPNAFGPWLGRIVRNLSLDRYRRYRAAKRGQPDTELLFSELENCLPSAFTPESAVDEQYTAGLISEFLREQTPRNREIFLRRYWYGDSIADICARFHIGQSRVKSSLFRMRNSLKDCLEKGGILI